MVNPVDFVRTLPPFNELTSTELESVKQYLTTVHFPPGTTLMSVQDGEPSGHLYLIQQGAVRLERDEQSVMILEEGELFGYPSMLSGKPPAFTVVAQEATLVYQWPESIFRQLLDNQGFAEFFLRSLSERLRDTVHIQVPALGGNLAVAVGSLISREPVFVSPATTIIEAARTMRDKNISSVLINGDPPGIVTDRDLRNRVLAAGLSFETPVRQIMSQPLLTQPATVPVHGALLFMLEQNIHHLALTREAKVIGMVTNSDLLRHQANSPFYLLRQLEKLENLEELPFYSEEIAKIVATLANGGLDVVQIGRVVTSLNDTLVRRIILLVEKQLGPPPTAYAWIVFGSEGRMEQTILTDQDNALIYDQPSPQAERYFKLFAERVGDALLAAGFPPCPGGYMAKNWCRPLADWQRLFDHWINVPEPQSLLDAAIFFDFRAVHGTLSLDPLEKRLLQAGKKSLFLAQFARAALGFRPPLGWFQRIREENGHVNLKTGGIAPIVALARVYALEAHSRARSTLERLQAAARAGTLSQDGANTLIESFHFLSAIRMRDQLTDLREGRKPDNRIRMEDQLSVIERRHLKEAFVAIRQMQNATAQRYHTDTLG
ncbi:MAG: DUF294 nucleotidyltransferase-like domain-containing protein [Ardenticatenaceae bacterium]